LEVQTAIRDRANERLLGVTGISLDQEMADLLRFEQSYQAAGRLIATVDSMIKAIIDLGR
jgi:flagellar hook-associated protein 1